MNVLVLGATGLTGRLVVEKLLKRSGVSSVVVPVALHGLGDGAVARLSGPGGAMQDVLLGVPFEAVGKDQGDGKTNHGLASFCDCCSILS
tara:strand:- start:121 stop:390 length:270 start_codon:yes stop_codon:yes gene_type:complete